MLTPKEKAQELVFNFKELAHYDWHPQTGYDMNQGLENAKQCAIIVVDELIKDSINVEEAHGNYYTSNKQYWQEVKKEIEKL